MKKYLLFVFLFCLATYLKAQQGNQLVSVTDMTLIKQLGTASFSHNGKQVVFTVKHIMPDENTILL